VSDNVTVTVSMPKELADYLDSQAGGNRSEYVRDLLKQDRNSSGVLHDDIAETWIQEARNDADHYERQAKLAREKQRMLEEQVTTQSDNVTETVQDALDTLSDKQIERLEPDHDPAEFWSDKAGTDPETFVAELKEAYNNA